MERFGIPQKIVRLVQAMYDGYTCQVEHRGKLSQPFAVNSGVRQGCLLSPILFIIALDSMLREATNRKRGIQWGLNSRLEELDYADDLCLLAESLRDMEFKSNDLKIEAKQVGLKINNKQTKEMRINHRNNSDLILDRRVIAVSYTHLDVYKRQK